MAVPETYELVLPLLEIIKDKDEYKVKEITDEVIEYIDLAEEDKQIKLPNNEPLIESRISTANTYLKKAELIESNRFMYFNITEEGLRVLSDNPDEITEEDLMEYPGFKEYKQVFIHDDTKNLDINELTPADALKESFQKQMEDVKREIEEERQKEKAKSNNKKYFQSKEYKDSDEVFGIKANRDAKKKSEDKYSKHHERKHKHGKDKCKSHHKHKKLVINIEFSPAEELLNYAELFEKGYLTKEEFEKKKEELLKIDYTL